MSQERVTRGTEIESVVLNSSRFINPAGINIYGLVTDIEIFEHLDLPYITGQIAFVDTERLLDRIMFDGGETITIKMKQSADAKIIEKLFYIDSIIGTSKINVPNRRNTWLTASNCISSNNSNSSSSLAKIFVSL